MDKLAGRSITLEDYICEPDISVDGLDGIVSMKDGEKYTTLENYRNIVRYEYKSGKIVDTLVSLTNRNIGLKYIYDYTFNNSEDKILLSTNIEPIYRHSFTADYFLYNLKTNKVDPLSRNGSQQLADFSPDGKNIAFFRENNIYLKDLETNSEIQITI
ncbi:MAG: hypothetical protein HC905_25620 [Bacteroidales bacterium]|nr:hypothetical protein [Bacteroidales bacterium]